MTGDTAFIQSLFPQYVGRAATAQDADFIESKVIELDSLRGAYPGDEAAAKDGLAYRAQWWSSDPRLILEQAQPYVPPTETTLPVVNTPPATTTVPTPTPAATDVGTGITALPLVGPIIGQIATATGISPWWIALAALGAGLYAFGAFDGGSTRRR